jgi:hypothetical protein
VGSVKEGPLSGLSSCQGQRVLEAKRPVSERRGAWQT